MQWLRKHTYTNENDHQVAHILTLLIMASWVAYFAVFLFSLYYHDRQHLVIAVVGAVLQLAPLWLLRHRQVFASICFLSLETLGGLTLIATFGQGYRDIAVFAFPVILVFTCLTTNRSVFYIYVALMLASISWLVFGQMNGWFMPAEIQSGTYWADFFLRIIVVLLSAFIIDVLVRNMRRNLKHAQDECTLRQQAERTLRQSEEKYRALVETTGTGFLILDGQGRVVDANQEYVRLTGHGELREILGRHVAEWTAGHEKQSNEEAVARCIRDRKIRNLVIDYIDFKGRVTPVEINATVHDDGESLRIISLCRDVSERRLAEAALQESETRYRQLFDSSPDGIVLIGTDGRIARANIAQARLYRYESPGDLIGVQATELVAPSCRDYSAQIMQRRLNGEDVPSVEYELARRDGTVFFGETLATTLRSSDGAISGYICITRDITERKRAEEALRNSQKFESLGVLAGGIAHDFNNILGAIVGYADMSRDDAPAESRLLRNLNQILISADRAKALVNQILTFSRQQPDEMNPMYVTMIVKEVVQMLHATLPATIELRRHLAPDTIPILGNPTRIHELVMNLCINASHAMEERGVIEVSHEEVTMSSDFHGAVGAGRAGRYSVIAVKDNGCGIPADVLPHIFEPFYTTKSVGQGTGMGLSVVAGVVQSHGGCITVDSKPGEGSVFRVFLPKSDCGFVNEASEDRDAPRGSESVLFIDDENDLCDIAVSMLGTLGYSVTAFTDSLKALDEFKHQSDAYDIVITDQTMPIMTGIELSHELLRIRKDIPIILCTGFSKTIDKKTALGAGFKAFCIKPINKADIAREMRRVLDTCGDHHD